MALVELPQFDLSASPTVWEYVMSESFVSGITGPLGSGKSVGSCIKILRHAAEMPPSENGYRRVRVAVIRNTYPELRTTTIKTWEDTFIGYRVPPLVYGAPIRHHIKLHPSKNFKWMDKKKGHFLGVPGLDLEVWFLALDKPADVKHLKSMEITFAFINEASEIIPDILDMLTGRVGRFPKHGEIPFGEPFVGIFYDTNAADEANWTEKYPVDTPPELEVELEDGSIFNADWSFYRQPPAVLECDAHNVIIETGSDRRGEQVEPQRVMVSAGRRWTINPGAENLTNLKRGYYNQQITNKKLAWIQRYLQSKTIYISEGEAWTPEFSQTHMVTPLVNDPALPLLCGIDIGGGTLQPAAILGQCGPQGDWRILHEIVRTEMGLEAFVQEFMREVAIKFPKAALHRIYLDPAAAARDPVYETAIEDHLLLKGLPVELAPTNDIKTRREALIAPMSRQVHLPNGHTVSGFLVDPSCKQLIAALSGKWFKKVIERAGSRSVDEKPVKNQYSNPGDGCSYLLLGGGEHQILTMGRQTGTPDIPLREKARRSGGAIQIEIEHDI